MPQPSKDAAPMTLVGLVMVILEGAFLLTVTGCLGVLVIKSVMWLWRAL